MKKNPSNFDLIIVGGGPIGLACAIEAEKAKLNYLVLEKGVLVNSLYRFPTNMTFFSTSKLLEIGGVPFISHNDKPTRQESLEYFRRVVDSWNLNIRYHEEVLSMTEQDGGGYQIETKKTSFTTHSVIVATGFYDLPRMMDIPGEDLPKVKHFYDDAHPYIGMDVLVVGAANSACDIALETWQKGAKVTMAVRKPEISPRVKYWIKPNIENRIKEGSIKAHFNTTVKEIRDHEVDLETPEGTITIPNDFALAMTGYTPNYRLLDSLGIAVDDSDLRLPILNEDTLETNRPNVYLAGVVCGGLHTSRYFIENSRVHAEMIIPKIVDKIQAGVTA